MTLPYTRQNTQAYKKVHKKIYKSNLLSWNVPTAVLNSLLHCYSHHHSQNCKPF